MLGNVLRNQDVNSDEGDIPQRPAGGGDAAARTPARNLRNLRRSRKRPGGADHQPDVDRDGFGYSRQPQADRLAQGKTFVSYSWTKFVPIHQAEEYRSLGWELKDAGHPHNRWSYIGVWRSLRDDPPP